MQEVIIKYSGDISGLEEALDIEVEILNENYAIITLEPEKIPSLLTYSQIEGIELPKTISYQLTENLRRACIAPVQKTSSYGLSGKGTIVAILDSGIRYTHPDFCNEDGTTRILAMWDQTAIGTPPEGFKGGVEYSEAQINTALSSDNPDEIVPETDVAGHGTAVAGVAAGNGRASNGRNVGAAPEASLLIVKLGERGRPSFARTTELMRALKYVIDKAQALNMPISINISFGTNNGAHDGKSLFEIYIDDMAQRWKTSIVVAAGNEGDAGHHYRRKLTTPETFNIPFFVSGGLPSLYLTLWKNFVDTFAVELVFPSGNSTGVFFDSAGVHNAKIDNTSVLINYSRPSYYSQSQEIYFQVTSADYVVPSGVWMLQIAATQVIDGVFDIWLPTVEEVTRETTFTTPERQTTLTLPSTAENVISVGGYNSPPNTLALFSGYGNTRNNEIIKPDLVAPAVSILAPSKNGGYDAFTGTSIAAPFVTGSAALMMEWGIIKGNDPFLFGERIKAYLQKGASRDAFRQYPDIGWGYGTLCLSRTMDLLNNYWKGAQST